MTEMEEKEPFQLRSYIQDLTKLCKDDFLHTDDIAERIRIICSKEKSLEVGKLVHEEDAWPRKDDDLSRTNREDGNTAYNEGRFDMAILLYTEAMRYAPCNPVLMEGEALATAAANRSAAFYQTKQYIQAIEDIEIAISSGYPKNGHYKLYIRQCKCELELGRILRAQAAFDLAVEAIEWSGLTKDMRSGLTVNLQEAFINLAKQAELDGIIPEEQPDITLKEKELDEIPSKFCLDTSHPLLPAASESVKVKFDPTVGRHVVAARDILPGEVIFVERPIVSTVCDEHYENICIVCMRYTAAPVPCPTCSDATFCSLRCQKEGLATFHKYECRLTHVFHQTGIKNLPLLLLAFRAVCQKPASFFTQNKDKFEKLRPKFGTDTDAGLYHTEDYATLFNLCTHTERREDYDKTTKTVFACFLLRCLQETGYFASSTASTKASASDTIRDSSGKHTADDVDSTASTASQTKTGSVAVTQTVSLTLSEEEVLVARLLKHFLECIQFNTHTIESIYENRVVGWDAETRLWKSSLRCNVGDSVETVRIGGGVYPTMALVNHSCDPNFVLVFWGRVAVAIASRSIAAGEEINDNYGANYASMPLQERRPFLEKSHWFTCSCKACKNNYPEYLRCSKDYKKLPGTAFKYKRVDRQKLNRDVEVLKKDIKANVIKGNLEETYEIFLKWSELIDKLVYPPHQDFINIRKGVRNSIYQLSPNKCRARETKDEDER